MAGVEAAPNAATYVFLDGDGADPPRREGLDGLLGAGLEEHLVELVAAGQLLFHREVHNGHQLAGDLLLHLVVCERLEARQHDLVGDLPNQARDCGDVEHACSWLRREL